jgi:hypothetical protein
VSTILYRLRAEIRRQWLSWLGIALLIGVVAGPVLGLIAGARRTSTVYDRFLAETDPADVLIAESPDFGITKIDLQAAADLPDVEQVAISPVYFTVIRLEDDRLILPGNDAIVMVDPWSVGDGLNRPRAIRGRLADPADPTEVVVGFGLARRFGLEVGDTLEISLIQLESLPAAQLEFLATIEDRMATPAAELFDWESFVTGARVDVEVVGVTAAPSSSRRWERSFRSFASRRRSHRRWPMGVGPRGTSTRSSNPVFRSPTTSGRSRRWRRPAARSSSTRSGPFRPRASSRDSTCDRSVWRCSGPSSHCRV